jgi:hypothetical protein
MWYQWIETAVGLLLGGCELARWPLQVSRKSPTALSGKKDEEEARWALEQVWKRGRKN